jgi:hypothetical protein
MCKLVRVLYALFRLKRFRAYLVRTHFETCPLCGRADAEEAGWAGLVRPPDWISREASLWPEVERRLRESDRGRTVPGPAAAMRPSLKLAVAAGGVLAVAVLAVLLGKHPPSGTGAGVAAALQAPRVEVLSAEVEGRPARSSVYQTKAGSFIWFSPMPRKEG